MFYPVLYQPHITSVGIFLLWVASASAEITFSGDVIPDPTTTAWEDDLYIGDSTVGELVISSTSSVHDSSGIIGNQIDSNGTATVDGIGSEWSHANNLYVGKQGNGTLKVQNGGTIVVFHNSFIGGDPGSAGEVVVDGPGSSWSSLIQLTVGSAGDGTIMIRNGGTVFSHDGSIAQEPGSVGEGTIDGPESVWEYSYNLYVGYGGDGTLNIGHGGTAACAAGAGIGSSFIGELSSSSGTVTVAGPGSSWNSGMLQVGGYGNGMLTIQDGGSVISKGGFIGGKIGSAGIVTVDGLDSEWDIEVGLSIGTRGDGTLKVQNGGTVSTRGASIGTHIDSVGQVIVDGTGSVWNLSDVLHVGFDGTGTLTIQNGGHVLVSDTVYVNQNQTGSQIVFDNGTLSAKNVLVSKQELSGTGTINTQGWVFDSDLVLAQASDLLNPIVLDSLPGQYISVAIDLTSGVGDLGIGYSSTCSLTIQNSIQVTCGRGFSGYRNGSQGTIIVEETGSTWNCTNEFYIGYEGNGSLIVRDGGSVASSDGSIGTLPESAGFVTVDGSESRWNCNGDLYVGDTGAGNLLIQNEGAVTCGKGYISKSQGSVGTVTVDGAGSGWICTDELYIGRGSDGILNIENGATVSSRTSYINYASSSSSAVHVNGIGSAWHIDGDLHVGKFGNGELYIRSTATVEVNGTVDVDSFNIKNKIELINGTLIAKTILSSPYSFYGIGTINTKGWIFDSDLTITQASDLQQHFQLDVHPPRYITVDVDLTSGEGLLGVGNIGSGSLAIGNGMEVASDSGQLGRYVYADGQVVVDGIGSTWNIGSELQIGRIGKGTLTILNGGLVSAGLGQIAYSTSSIGTVILDGDGSEWNCGGELQLGIYGTGSLTIQNGASCTSDSGIIGYFSESTGTAIVDGIGSEWVNHGALTIGLYGSGTLSIHGGGLVDVDGDARIAYYGRSEGSLVSGIGADGCGLFQVEGTLVIRDHSSLLVDMDIGFVPAVGTQYTVATYGAIDGSFDNEPIHTRTGAYLLDWSVDYNANDLTLEVVSSILAGDFNEDGTVDINDYNVWAMHFGMIRGVSRAQGDADADGDVDGEDFLAWQCGFGLSDMGSNNTALSVPESSSLLLASLLLVSLWASCAMIRYHY